MPTKRCSWGKCNSDSRYKEKSHMQGVTFIPFPKPWINEEKCKAWIKACGRPHEQLNANMIDKYHYICSKHFENGKPTEQQPDPISADPYTGHRTNRKRKPPSVREIDIPSRKKLFTKKPSDLCETPSTSADIDNNELSQIDASVQTSPQKQKCSNSHCMLFSQPIITCNHCRNDTEVSKKDLKYLSKCRFMNFIQESDASCFYNTGVPYIVLLLNMFFWLEPYAKKIKLWDGKNKFENAGRCVGRKRKSLTLFEEFCLTLVRIRRGYDVILLSNLFGIAQSHVCRILPAWINFLAKTLKQLIIWPSKELVRKNLPESFKSYSRTRVIIDCTEIFVEKAFRPAAQRATWSSYKNANTFKLLVGIMPSGAVTFVSKLYSGSISDQSIVRESKFVDLLEEGDDVMADRGFNIRHLLLQKKATLNIPSFSHGKVLSSKAVKRSRRIASVRIHVERAIRRMKTFRILSGVIPIKLRFQLNQVITIIAALSNLQERLA